MAVTLPAGSLNRRITLVAPATTQDSAGGPGPDVPLGQFWAAIDSVSGQSLYQSQFVSQSTHKVTIRYQPNITPNLKVLLDAQPDGSAPRAFNILYVGNRQEANVALDLFCVEIL